MPSTNVGGIPLGELVLGSSESGGSGGGGGGGVPTVYVSVSHTLNLTQNIKYTNTKVQHQYTPFQIIGLTLVSNKSVTSELNLTDSIVAYKVRGVSQNLNLTQTIVAYDSKGVKSHLALTQSITHNNIHNKTITHNLGLNQIVTIGRNKAEHVQHGLGFVSTIQKQKVMFQSVDNFLTLNQEIARIVYHESISHVLGPTSTGMTQTISYTPVYPLSVVSPLVLTQSIGLNRVINHHVISNLVFLPTHSTYIGMGDIAYYVMDNIQYALIPAYKVGKKNNPHCVLQVPNGAITLPAPDWGDTEGYGGVFTIRRAMNGVPYTHVRTLSLRKLTLPWTLAKRKAWELREFLIQYNAELMTLTTWKGDKWFVNLMTNPFELVVSGRYDVENEKVQVELEFEGLKVM